MSLAQTGSAALSGLTQAAKKQIWTQEQYVLKQKLICSDSFKWVLPEKFGYGRNKKAEAEAQEEENQASILIGSVAVDLPDGYVNPSTCVSEDVKKEDEPKETVVKPSSTPTYLEKLMAGKRMTCATPPASAQNEKPNEEVKETLKYVGGMDLSFVKEDSTLACSALVVIDVETVDVVYEDFEIVTLEMPYIPGFLAFRESPALLKLLNKMKSSCPEKFPQLILTDGNGILHPRRFGLASHLGVLADVPTVGIGKTLFEVDGLTEHGVKKRARKELVNAGEALELKGRSGFVYGCALKSTQDCTNPVYVSVGHRISLQTSVEIVKRLCRFRVPEPVRQADMKSREFLRVRGYTQQT